MKAGDRGQAAEGVRPGPPASLRSRRTQEGEGLRGRRVGSGSRQALSQGTEGGHGPIIILACHTRRGTSRREGTRRVKTHCRGPIHLKGKPPFFRKHPRRPRFSGRGQRDLSGPVGQRGVPARRARGRTLPRLPLSQRKAVTGVHHGAENTADPSGARHSRWTVGGAGRTEGRRGARTPALPVRRGHPHPGEARTRACERRQEGGGAAGPRGGPAEGAGAGGGCRSPT